MIKTDLPETFTAALVACVSAAGGSKRVGPMLWPEKSGEGAAQRHLINCLKDDRAERLTPDQVLFVMGLGRAAGCHVAMEYIANALGYAPPVPIEPKDELAELQRQAAATVESMANLVQRMEALQAGNRLYAPLRAA